MIFSTKAKQAMASLLCGAAFGVALALGAPAQDHTDHSRAAESTPQVDAADSLDYSDGRWYVYGKLVQPQWNNQHPSETLQRAYGILEASDGEANDALVDMLQDAPADGKRDIIRAAYWHCGQTLINEDLTCVATGV